MSSIYKYYKELYEYRELLLTLTIREIKVRYKQTLLGSAWAVIQPFSLMLLFTIVFGFFMKIDTAGIPYPIFAYSALLPWTFFSTSISFGALSIINNSSLVGKVYFPKEVLPMASIGAAIVDLLIASVIYIGMLYYYDMYPGFSVIFAIPILMILIIFTMACTLIGASIVVVFRDIKFVIPLALQLLLFMVPVIYPIENIPDKYRALYLLNPLASTINSFRAITLGNANIDYLQLLETAVVSILIFIAGYIFFKKQERVFADLI